MQVIAYKCELDFAFHLGDPRSAQICCYRTDFADITILN
jgi:hypothetical protein